MKTLSRRWSLPLFLLGIHSPGFAMADSAGVLDFTTGAPGALLGKTLGISKEYFVFALIAALLVEAFGHSPTEPRSYPGVLFRGVIILTLLQFYIPVFGSVVTLTQGLTSRIESTTNETFGKDSKDALQKQYAKRTQADDDAAAVAKANGESVNGSDALGGSYFGGAIYDALIHLFALLGDAIFFVVKYLSRLLCGLFYVLGPLALVFSIPRPSNLASRWFGHFVTFSTWPIFSALLLAINRALGGMGGPTHGMSATFGTIVATLLTIIMAVATPTLASLVVGGTTATLVGQGAGTVMGAIAMTRLAAGKLGRGPSNGGGGGGRERQRGAGQGAGATPGSARERQ